MPNEPPERLKDYSLLEANSLVNFKTAVPSVWSPELNSITAKTCLCLYESIKQGTNNNCLRVIKTVRGCSAKPI